MPARMTSPAIVALFIAVALAVAWLNGGYMATLVARGLILALGAVSLSFLIGQAGLVSFGHAAPIGIGAYAALALGEADISDLFAVLPAAAATAALFSAVTGLVALRTRGVYFIMITLAFAQMAYFVAASLSVYGGDDGLALARRATLFGTRILKGDAALATLAGLILIMALLGLDRLKRARFGLVLNALRQNEARMAASGHDALPLRLAALAISGALAGLSGALLANQAEFVAPAYMNWHRSGELIVMVVLGGTGRLGGAVLGAAAVLLIEEVLGHYTEYWKLGLGLLIVAVALARAGTLTALVKGRTHA